VPVPLSDHPSDGDTLGTREVGRERCGHLVQAPTKSRSKTPPHRPQQLRRGAEG